MARRRTADARTLSLTHGRLRAASRRPTRRRRRPRAAIATATVDPEIQDILVAALARPRAGRARCCASEEGLTAALVPHVIPLLAWDPVAADAVFALRKVAEERVGELIDALIDPNQDFAVRRRLARVFSVCVSQRAADGLHARPRRPAVRGPVPVRPLAGGDCSRRIRESGSTASSIFAVVLREVAVGRPVWESRRLLDELDDAGRGVVRRRVRAGPRRPEPGARLHAAVAGAAARAAADCVSQPVTPTISTCRARRSSTSKACCRRQSASGCGRFSRIAVPVSALDASARRDPRRLLRSNQSIMLNLEELKRRSGQRSQSSRRPLRAGSPVIRA